MDLCKNEKMRILRQLIPIEESLIFCKLYLAGCLMVPNTEEYRRCPSLIYVDKERYLNMAMRLDPNDSFILERKKKEILCKYNPSRLSVSFHSLLQIISRLTHSG